MEAVKGLRPPGRSLVALVALLAAARVDGEPCRSSNVAAIFVSPESPAPGGPLRAIAISDQPLEATLAMLGPDGNELAVAGVRRGGPPYWWHAEVRVSEPGIYRLQLGREACTEAQVGGERRERRGGGGAWPVTRPWDGAVEGLYSGWVEKLFDDPIEAEPSWRSLHEVTREPARNFLHGDRSRPPRE